MVIVVAAAVVAFKRTITILEFYNNYSSFLFQIFVLSDSTKLSLELGVPLEFVQEKRNEIERCVFSLCCKHMITSYWRLILQLVIYQT